MSTFFLRLEASFICFRIRVKSNNEAKRALCEGAGLDDRRAYLTNVK